ncbi:hypothetical protein J8J40_21905, partial [Mycobacterium tuberculosis]|nr:hypothetical protein [Mycobacterium tuberculosis]
MALSPRLELKQSQSLVMTPQLMQAIKLLQLGSMDLVAYVDAELERNPLLERDEAGDGEGRGDGAEGSASPAEMAEAADDAPPAPTGDPADFEAEASFSAASTLNDSIDTDLS